MGMTQTHTHKKNIETLLLRGTGDDVGRISLNVEEHVSELPVMVLPTHVRIQQRKSFVDERDGDVVWSYDISRIWSAGSRSSVEHLQHVSEAKYEVECELKDAKANYISSLTDCEVAESLMTKMQNLLGHTSNTTYVIIDTKERTRRKRFRG